MCVNVRFKRWSDMIGRKLAVLSLNTVQTLWVLYSQPKIWWKIPKNWLDSQDSSFLDVCNAAKTLRPISYGQDFLRASFDLWLWFNILLVINVCENTRLSDDREKQFKSNLLAQPGRYTRSQEAKHLLRPANTANRVTLLCSYQMSNTWTSFYTFCVVKL